MPPPQLKETLKAHVVKTPGLRSLFRAKKGRYLVEADYSQLELRIVALLANDEPYLETFKLGKDVHRVNAADFYGITEDEVTDKERESGKTVVYGLGYGGGVDTIYSQIAPKFPAITKEMIRLLISRYYTKHPAIKAFQDKNLQNALDLGYVQEPLTGAVYPFYGDIKPTVVFNFPIQTAAAYIVKKAMKRIAARLNWIDEAILMQIHDALVLEGPNWQRLVRILKQEMTKAVSFGSASMVFPVDIKVGTNWGELIKLKDWMKQWPSQKLA